MEFDLHLHTIASGHGSRSTITDMAKAAAKKDLKMIGISDHGPHLLHAGRSTYFLSLAHAPKVRCGIKILYGVELNIIDYNGNVDLPDEILSQLDYAIISMHPPCLSPGSTEQNTAAYLGAMKHPGVKIIGHCDDPRYPVDYDRLLQEAIRRKIVFEINNSSLSPDGYRGNTKDQNVRILKLCQMYNYPVLLSSDSHGTEHLGDFTYALKLLSELDFPNHLVLNHSMEAFS